MRISEGGAEHETFYASPATCLDKKGETVANGLQLVDGKPFLANPTRTDGDFFGKDGGPVLVTVRVRKGEVTALTDGQVRFRWKGDVSKLGHDEGFWKLPDKTRLAIAVQNAEYRISEWRLYPVEATSAPGGAMPVDAAFPGEVVFREPYDQVHPNLANISGKDATVRSADGVLEVRWPAAADRPVPSTRFYAFGPAVENVAFAVRLRTHAATYAFSFRRLEHETGQSGLSFLVNPDGSWSLTRLGTRLKGKELTLDGPVVLKESGGPNADLAAGKWAALTVRSAGATTEVWLNGQPLASVTEAKAPGAGKSTLDLDVSLLDRGAVGFDLDYLVVWKLPAPAVELRKAVEWVLKSGGQVRVVQAPGKSYKLQKAEDLDKVANPRLRIDLLSDVTDAALDNLAAVTDCEALQLRGGTLSDAGLKKLAGLPPAKTVREVLLVDVGVTDDGLAHLAGCPALTLVQAVRTKVTKAGAEALAKALPKCKIEYDGGVIEPKK